MDVIVTYDVDTTTRAGEQRLGRVAKVCEGYGVRVQYSVFECRISQTTLAQMIGELADEIEPRQDSVNVYRFAGDLAASRLSLGRRPPRDPGRPWII